LSRRLFNNGTERTHKGNDNCDNEPMFKKSWLNSRNGWV